jgi:hypothetical protein
MRVIVAGGIKQPLLLDTKDATSVIFLKDDDTPMFLMKMLPNGRGYIRLTKGEDKNFDETARQLGFKI